MCPRSPSVHVPRTGCARHLALGIGSRRGRLGGEGATGCGRRGGGGCSSATPLLVLCVFYILCRCRTAAILPLLVWVTLRVVRRGSRCYFCPAITGSAAAVCAAVAALQVGSRRPPVFSASLVVAFTTSPSTLELSRPFGPSFRAPSRAPRLPRGQLIPWRRVPP